MQRTVLLATPAAAAAAAGELRFRRRHLRRWPPARAREQAPMGALTERGHAVAVVGAAQVEVVVLVAAAGANLEGGHAHTPPAIADLGHQCREPVRAGAHGDEVDELPLLQHQRRVFRPVERLRGRGRGRPGHSRRRLRRPAMVARQGVRSSCGWLRPVPAAWGARRASHGSGRFGCGSFREVPD